MARVVSRGWDGGPFCQDRHERLRELNATGGDKAVW